MLTSFSICFVPVSGPRHRELRPVRERAAERDDVAALLAHVVDEEANLDAALLGEQRRVQRYDRLAHDGW
jgi:hypothetical protein